MLLGAALLVGARTVSAQTVYGSRTVVTKTDATKSFRDDADFLQQLHDACRQASENYEESDNDQALLRSRGKLRKEVKNLLYLLNRNQNRKDAVGWIQYLRLNELQRSLLQNEVNREILDGAFNRFTQDQEGLDEPYFVKVRNALSDYIGFLDTPKTLEARKKTFNDVSQLVVSAAETLLTKDDADCSESITASLRLMREEQPESEYVRVAGKLIRQRFGRPNIEIEVSERSVFSEPRSFSEDISVRENIRGTDTVGSGTASGTVTLGFAENPNQAEIKVQLNSRIVTRTTGYNQGTQVQSANTGQVSAVKSIFLTDQIKAGTTQTSGTMDTKLLSINSGRGPIGTSVVYDRVYQELPYSKAESQRRMERRMADRLDSEVGKRLSQPNGLSRFMKFLRENDYAPRNLSSSTTDSRLRWSALIGSDYQPGPGRAPVIDSASYDFCVRIHQSAPNNAAFFALEGMRISEQDFLDKMSEAFPGLEKKLPKKVVVKKPAEGEKDAKLNDTPLEAPESEKPFYLTFAEELPLTTVFANDRITLTAHIDLFEQEGKEWPGLDMEIVYAIEKKDNKFTLRRDSIDAWPAGSDRSAAVPARFQAIRTQLLKRLDEGLKKEYAVESITLSNSFGKEATEASVRGVLSVAAFTAQDGWLQIGAKYLSFKGGK